MTSRLFLRLLALFIVVVVIACSSVKSPDHATDLTSSVYKIPWEVYNVTDTTGIENQKKSGVVHDAVSLRDGNSIGLKKGDDFPDAILYREDGTPFIVGDELQKQNKIFLLISGSYSCPAFRREIPQIDTFREKYGDRLKTYIVYTVEAHPQDIASPYRDSVWLMNINRNHGVYIDQAKTFAERVNTAKIMTENTGLKTEILFDGPDNRFWHQLGQAPVFCYVIDKDKKVLFHQKNLEISELNTCVSGFGKD